MLSRAVFFILGLPFVLLCCLIAPVLYIMVIAVSPLGLLYRYAVKPVLAGNEAAGGTSVIAHRSAA